MPGARLLLLVAGLAAGCRSEKAAPPSEVWSCLAVRTHNCREYRAPAGIDSLRSACATTPAAAFANAPCPAAAVVGRCVQRGHTDVFYEGYPIQPRELPAACTTGGGTFSPR